MALTMRPADAYSSLTEDVRLPPARGATPLGPGSPEPSARPGSPPFQINTMDEIRETARVLTESRSQSMLPRGLADRIGAKDDPSHIDSPTRQHRSENYELDDQPFINIVLTDSATWLLVQKRESEMIAALQGEADLADGQGWTCLHWAALQGYTSHVAAILDSGADFSLETKVAIKHASGDRRAGVDAEELARYPGGTIKGHDKIIALLQAAQRGGWQQRKMCKQNGDAAVAAQNWTLAVHWYEKALGAVL